MSPPDFKDYQSHENNYQSQLFSNEKRSHTKTMLQDNNNHLLIESSSRRKKFHHNTQYSVGSSINGNWNQLALKS